MRFEGIYSPAFLLQHVLCLLHLNYTRKIKLGKNESVSTQFVLNLCRMLCVFSYSLDETVGQGDSQTFDFLEG